jgi:adenine-specific DNA glycosylase
MEFYGYPQAPSRFTTAERAPETKLTGNWVGPNAEHDTTEKRMISCTYIHTHTHTHIYTHTHIFTHTHTHSHFRAFIVQIYIQRIQKFARIIGCGIQNMQIVQDAELLKHTHTEFVFSIMNHP